jgi:hypothetical protein
MNATVAVPPKYQRTPNVSFWLVVVFAVASLAGGAILFLFNPVEFGFYPICVFHQMTGLLCPGCGSLRALHQLLHGHFAAACHFNALLILSLPLLVWHGVRITIRQMKHAPPLAPIRPRWVWWAFAVVLLFGVLRNLPFVPLPWLRP